MSSWRFIVSFALVAIAGSIGGTNAKSPSRIVGGETAAVGEFPYVVSISRYSVKYKLDLIHTCGGAIISRRHILTAGHCVTGEGNMTVNSGVNDLSDKNVVSRKVVNVILHPRHSPQTDFEPVRNDIAILELDEDLQFNGRVKKIALPTEEPSESKRGYVIAGWGKIDPGQLFAQLILKKTPIRLLDENECYDKEQRSFEKPEMLCGYQENAALCVGDSGSPLALDNTVVGVASRSSCNPAAAHIYTSVHNYIDWIRSTIGSALD